jgi:hypothetical protein
MFPSFFNRLPGFFTALTRKVFLVERFMKRAVCLPPVLIFHVTGDHCIFLRACGQEVLEKIL